VVIVVLVKMFPAPTVMTVGPMATDSPPTLGPAKLREPGVKAPGLKAGRDAGENWGHAKEYFAGGVAADVAALAVAAGTRIPIVPTAATAAARLRVDFI
jgi:hypothetical protein